MFTKVSFVLDSDEIITTDHNILDVKLMNID